MTVLWAGSVDQLDENPGRGMILAHVVQDWGQEMPCWGRDCVPPGISAGGSSFHSAAPVPLGQSGPSARGTVLIGGMEGTEVMAPISWGLVLPSSPPIPAAQLSLQPLTPHLPLSSRSFPACGPAGRCWMWWTAAPCCTGCRWKVAASSSPPTPRGEGVAAWAQGARSSFLQAPLSALGQQALRDLQLPSSQPEASGPRPPLPSLPVPTAPRCAGHSLKPARSGLQDAGTWPPASGHHFRSYNKGSEGFSTPWDFRERGFSTVSPRALQEAWRGSHSPGSDGGPRPTAGGARWLPHPQVQQSQTHTRPRSWVSRMMCG